jgi:hypothetical protein
MSTVPSDFRGNPPPFLIDHTVNFARKPAAVYTLTRVGLVLGLAGRTLDVYGARVVLRTPSIAKLEPSPRARERNRPARVVAPKRACSADRVVTYGTVTWGRLAGS